MVDARRWPRAWSDPRRRRPRLLLDPRGGDVCGSSDATDASTGASGQGSTHRASQPSGATTSRSTAACSCLRGEEAWPLSARVDRVEAWVVLGALGAVVTLNIPFLGADPWRFRPGSITPAGPLGFLVRLADGEWDLGLDPIGSDARRSRRRRSGDHRLPRAHVESMGARARVLRGRRGTRASSDGTPGRVTRFDRSVVLHERLHVPARTRGGTRGRSREPLWARLCEIRTRALLQPRRHCRAGHGRTSRRAPPLRLLPRRGARCRGAGAVSPRRGTTFGSWLRCRRSRCLAPRSSFPALCGRDSRSVSCSPQTHW